MFSLDFLKSTSASLTDNGHVGVLDIGASKVSCFIAQAIRSDTDGYVGEITGVGHQANTGTGAASVAEVSADLAVRAAVDKAQRMAGHRPDSWHVAVSGRHLACRRLAVDLDVNGHVVTENDLRDCFREGAKLAADEGMVPLHIWPSSFAVDGLGGVRDPRGLTCDHLTVEMVSVAASRHAIRNLTACLERCRLKAESFIAAPYAAALAVLQEEEASLGVLCLDMGATLTSFTVYRDNALVFSGAVPLGSDHITRDIALAFGVSEETAERTKTVHGTGFCTPGDDMRFVDFDTRIYGSGQASVTELAEVIGPRLEEILKLVFSRLNEAEIDHRVLRRCVVTGGGSQLQGILDLISELHDMQARIGRPVNLIGAPEAVSNCAFSVCAGMVDHATRSRAGENYKVPHLLTDHLQEDAGYGAGPALMAKQPWQKAANWLRTHF